jgi:hypothetical protein
VVLKLETTARLYSRGAARAVLDHYLQPAGGESLLLAVAQSTQRTSSQLNQHTYTWYRR